MNDRMMLVLVAALGVIVGVAVAWVLLRRRMPPRVVEDIGAAIGAIALALGRAISEAEIVAIARWTYNWAGISEYYTPDEWAAFLRRLLPRVVATSATLQRHMTKGDVPLMRPINR